MLSPGNPYVLPSVLIAAGVYLALTALTDASVLVRVGVLAFIAGAVPMTLNRVLGGLGTSATGAAASDEPTDDAGSESGDGPTG